jgi:hypothetical protein
MKTNTILRATIAAILATGFAVAPVTTFAGATVFHQNWNTNLVCYDSSYDGARVCFQMKGTWKEVSTPSGNYNYMLKGTVFSSSSYGSNSSQTTEEVQEKILVKANMPHIGRSFNTVQIVNAYNGGCTAYTTEYDYSFVNGNVTQNNYTFSENPC